VIALGLAVGILLDTSAKAWWDGALFGTLIFSLVFMLLATLVFAFVFTWYSAWYDVLSGALRAVWSGALSGALLGAWVIAWGGPLVDALNFALSIVLIIVWSLVFVSAIKSAFDYQIDDDEQFFYVYVLFFLFIHIFGLVSIPSELVYSLSGYWGLLPFWGLWWLVVVGLYIHANRREHAAANPLYGLLDGIVAPPHAPQQRRGWISFLPQAFPLRRLRNPSGRQ
jgi:hypothetical protein